MISCGTEHERLCKSSPIPRKGQLLFSSIQIVLLHVTKWTITGRVRQMAQHQITLIPRQTSSCNSIRTLTITKPDTTIVEVLTLGNGATKATSLPETIAPASKSSTSTSSYVGPILSAVVLVVVLLLVIWICCRKGI